MAITFTIAWRNLWRHKGKSLIVGTILFFGALVMTAGNAVVSGMERGMQGNVISRFTGELVLVSTNTEFDNILYTMMGENVSEIRGYSNIKPVLQGKKYIKGFLPAARGVSYLLNEEGQSDGLILFGVEFDEYQKMFGTNVLITEGRGFGPNERGLLLNVNNRKNLFDFNNLYLAPVDTALVASNLPPEFRSNLAVAEGRVKRDVVLMGFGDDETSVDIRVPVRGIFNYRNLNEIWQAINLMDLQSFRECFNYTVGDEKTVVSEQKLSLLKSDTGDLDKMFDNGGTVVDAGAAAGGYDLATLRQETSRAGLAPIMADAGSYNVVFIKLQPGTDIDDAKADLAKALAAAKVDARVMDWKGAIGQIADMAGLLKAALAGFVFFIFFVAIIVIMNTLSMSAIERTSEIGMMRAVGAQKGLIARMFLTEIMVLSGGFGGAGIICGMVLTGIVASLGITTDNGIAQLLFGGDRFAPVLTAGDLVACVFELGLVTLLAWIYPARVARRITPLEAIARE